MLFVKLINYNKLSVKLSANHLWWNAFFRAVSINHRALSVSQTCSHTQATISDSQEMDTVMQSMNFTRNLSNTVFTAYISESGGVNCKLKQWSGTKLLVYFNLISDLSSDLSFCNFENPFLPWLIFRFSEIPSLIPWASPHLHIY